MSDRNPRNQSALPTTTKQRRAQQRAAKVAAYQAAQARQARKRRLGIIAGIGGGVAAVALLVSFIVVSSAPSANAGIEGLQTFENTNTHVAGAVEYAQTPPAGGEHNVYWLNCGIYDQPVQNEHAVHSLEHGAVWVTYDPELPDDEVDRLRERLPNSYAILSPYEDLPARIVVSAWNRQVHLTDADDERLDQFVSAFWRSDDVPEPGAACTGGIQGEGRVG